MSIKKASDLHFKYVKNTTELRGAFITKCKEFGIGVFGFGGETYLEVYSDGYDEFEISGTDSLEPQSKELTMADLTGIPTETPEEKEALDSIESVGEVDWKNGDECIHTHHGYKVNPEMIYIGKHPKIKGKHFCISPLSGTVVVDAIYLSKTETPQQREDRERLASAYDLYECGQSAIKCIGYEEFNSFKNDDCAVKFWLAIVDKTKYRKEPKS